MNHKVQNLNADITSSVTVVKSSGHTKALSKETQLQAARLKTQGRVSATQKAMETVRNAEVKEPYLAQLLNASSDPIYTVDRDFRFVTWNAAFEMAAKLAGQCPEKGLPAFEWDAEFRQYVHVAFKRALQGETFEFNTEASIDGKLHHFVSKVTPLTNESGDIVEVAVFSKDITVIVKAQKNLELLLKLFQTLPE